MTDNSKSSREEQLERRLEHLEAKVDRLQEQLHRVTSQKPDTFVVDTKPEDEPEAAGEGASQRTSITEKIDLGENWLNRIGIGLMLFGVAFLFKYSIDQGWLIPPVRSLMGLGIGLALFVPGLQISPAKSNLKPFLLGGGIGVFYITGFATFQLYSFVSPGVVWAFMIAVTLLALSLSLQQDQAILSITGILGGLGTPFMLYTGSGSLVSLMIYTGLVLAGASVIYLLKGWKSLLWTIVAGGWLVLLVAYFSNVWMEPSPLVTDQWALQVGVLVGAVIFWLVPLARELLAEHHPDNWENAPPPGESSTIVSIMALAVPILSLAFSMGIWDMSQEFWGVIALAFSFVIAYAYLPLRKENLHSLASIHAFTALIILTVSFFLLLEGDLLFAVLALEGLGLRILAHSTADANISVGSHILFGITFVWLADQLMMYDFNQQAILNLDALTYLLILGAGGLAVPYWTKSENGRLIYRLIAHILFLGWFLHELYPVENGQAYITVCWGIYAVGLLIGGIFRNISWLRTAGMATIFAVVGKLFLIDLSQLEAIWRILLFTGFGALFLLLSFYLQRSFKAENESEGEESVL